MLSRNDLAQVGLFAEEQNYLVGKIYSKTAVEKEDYSSILNEHLEVIGIVDHPFVPKFYQAI